MEFDNQRPIWIQIADTIRQNIVSGHYPPGTRLPSVREWALELRVNPNTVVKALAQLEREGLILTRRGSGKYVAQDSQLFQDRARDEAQMLTDRYLADMQRLGLQEADILALIRERGKL